MHFESAPVVVDIGSYSVKAAIAYDNEDDPIFTTSISNISGTSHSVVHAMPGIPYYEYWIGSKAQQRRGILNTNYCMEHGIMNNDKNDIEKILHDIFYSSLEVGPEECPILLTEPVLQPRAQRRKLAEILFESFFVPAVYIADQDFLGMIHHGKPTGVVVNSGHGVTTVSAFDNGSVIPSSVQRMNIGGADVTECLAAQLINQPGSDRFMVNTSGREIIRELKEEHCFISPSKSKSDFEKEKQKANENPIDLFWRQGEKEKTFPSIGSERVESPEILFSPSMMNDLLSPSTVTHHQQPLQQTENTKGIHELLAKSIQNSPREIRDILCHNIVAFGGNTLFRGFNKRLNLELRQILNRKDIHIRTDDTSATNAILNGGAKLATSPLFQPCWISQQDFQENGII